MVDTGITGVDMSAVAVREERMGERLEGGQADRTDGDEWRGE